MDIKRLREILGPVRLHCSPKDKVWLLDQHPATKKEIIKAAEIVLSSRLTPKSARRPRALREISPEPTPISELSRLLIGHPKRISIPLEDKYVLREIADLLRGLATVMHFESRRPDTSQRESLIRIRQEIDQTNWKIRRAARQAGIYWREGGLTKAERRRQAREHRP